MTVYLHQTATKLLSLQFRYSGRSHFSLTIQSCIRKCLQKKIILERNHVFIQCENKQVFLKSEFWKVSFHLFTAKNPHCCQIHLSLDSKILKNPHWRLCFAISCRWILIVGTAGSSCQGTCHQKWKMVFLCIFKGALRSHGDSMKTCSHGSENVVHVRPVVGDISN